MKHVQRMLGHDDAAMTLNVNASLFENDLDDVADRLDAAFVAAQLASVQHDGAVSQSAWCSRPRQSD